MQNAKPPTQISVPLDLLSGLYTESRPESLPPGASPLCINCDFEVGLVGPRPGKKSEFVLANFTLIDVAAFSDTTGTTAPWTGTGSGGGSVTLNNPTPGGNPSAIQPAVSSTLHLGDSAFTVTCYPFPTAGPIYMLFPIYIGPLGGVTPTVVSITSSTGEIWHRLAGPTLWYDGTQIPDHLNDYELWGVYLPNGLTANWQFTVTMTSGTGSGPALNNIMAFRNCTGVNAVNSVKKTAPGTINGAPITTNQNCVIASVSNVIDQGDPGWSIPAGTFLYHNDGSSPGLATAIYGSFPSVLTIKPAGTYDPAWTTQLASPYDCVLTNVAIIPATGAPGYNTSQTLEEQNFNVNIPPITFPAGTPAQQVEQAAGCGSTYALTTPTYPPILGLQVVVDGSQDNLSPDAVITVQLQLPDGTLSPTIYTGQLPLTEGKVTFGAVNDFWGFTSLTAQQLNSPNMKVLVKASATGGELVTFNIVSVALKVWTTNNPPDNINYLKTFAETGGEILNLFLASSGTFYQEDALNLPGVMVPVFTAIEPDSFAQSATVSDREFIAISNLKNGTDIPRVYSPPNFDRLSQVGPGGPCAATTTSAGSSIKSITQNPKVLIPTSSGGTSGSWIIWSDSPQDFGTFGTPATPGNVMTWLFPKSFPVPSYIKVGSNIVISGVQNMNGYNPNNGAGSNPAYYTVISVGQPDPNQDYYDAFSIIIPQTGFYNARFQAGSAFQATIATLTTTTQVPNLEVGGQFQIAGTGGAPPTGYDGNWTVIDTPNASQLQITSTQLANNVATYGYNLETGTAPVAGETITVAQTLNGNGIFNVRNAVIASANAGSFTINIVSPNITSTPENGTGIIYGTVFTFDPFAIVGNIGAIGQVVVTGEVTAGIRKVCYSFLTRNGFLTQPSPILEFDVPFGANSIAIGKLAIGPPNVVARVIHFTAANGGNFYNIPVPVTVTNNDGTTTKSDSTWILDNTTTNVVLSFTDDVLLASTESEIDIQGNNLFECYELGSCIGVVPYAGRLGIIGEQNKVFNLLNCSFDGGAGVTQGNVGGGGGSGTNQTYPLGWTVDPTNGFGGSVASSPLFGSMYVITNASGSPQAVYGLISQPAYQDEFEVAIFQASTTYSVRLTAQLIAGTPTTGNIVIDLYSPALGRALGTYTLPLTSLKAGMTIFSGTLLTTVLAPVPTDLQIRLYATNIENGVSIGIDRIEPFPTEQPNLDRQVILSYAQNYEAFDRVTGIIDASVQNQQPIKSAFVLFDTLYLVKSQSIVAVNDNGSTEPSQWTVRSISTAIGTTSIYGVTTGIDQPNSGEEWAIIAGRAGVFLFTGGEPIKISEDIQSLWDQINWAYGHTIWVTNDVANRRICIGVPLKTPNTWLPTGIIPDNSNPTTPNVVIALNYKQLNSASALADRPPVRTSYSGKLIATEIVRKWSIWTIQAPAAAFLSRADGTAPLFVGNSAYTGKVYELIDNIEEGSDTWLQDDGSPFAQIYTTSGFVKGEEGEGRQMGAQRFQFQYASMTLSGSGSLKLTAFPNSLESPFADVLLPNLALVPNSQQDGDTEIPLNEVGSRLFIQFGAQCVGAAFYLQRLVMVMRQDAWSPVRGINY